MTDKPLTGQDCNHIWEEIGLMRTGIPFYVSPLEQCKLCKKIRLGKEMITSEHN